MTQHTLFVCILCRFSKTEREQNGLSGGQHLFDRLKVGLETCDWRDRINLYPVQCMGACDRPCVVAFAAPNKLTFLFSTLSPTQSIPELLQFGSQYITHSSGKVPYAERPAPLKTGLLAVLPPLPTPQC